MCDLSHIVAEETRDGRLIVRFLASAMEGQLPDFQPCHRLDAARLLVKLGFAPAQPVIDRADPARRTRSGDRHPPSESPGSDHRIRSELAQIVREETDQGRTAVRFLVSVMQGELPDFKPCHRLDAAKELLRRGFDSDLDDPDPQEAGHAQAEPAPDPAEIEAQRQLREHIEFSRHGPVYYESYSYPCVCEDRLHDCNGNALNPQKLEEVSHHAPAMTHFIDYRDGAEKEAFTARYADYLTRHNALNPHNPIDFNLIRWPKDWHPPGRDP